MRIIAGSAKGIKLYTLEEQSTRPTLDRVKEALFSIIQHYILDSRVLDLFSGSGALGLEALSRGAKKAILCDNSRKAISIIKQNVDKTKFNNKTELWSLDYKRALEKCKIYELQFDIIFLDPPYGKKLITDSIEKIIEYDIMADEGIIIAETDDNEELDNIKNLKIDIYDIRQYGRVKLIYINKRRK